MNQLDLELQIAGGQVAAVRIRNSRPDVARLLKGRTCEEAQALIASLYSICGKAQGVAAQLGAAAARGEPAQASAAQAFAIQREAAQEHLWRLLLDWPRALDLPAASMAFQQGYRLLAANAEPADLAAQLQRQLGDEWLTTSATRGNGQLAPRVAEVVDALRRSLQRQAALADELIQALVGRAQALARLLQAWRSGADEARDWAGAQSPGPQRGHAWTRTARGLLHHDVEVVAGRIADYRITAPTDAQFAEGGPFVRRLIGLDAADEPALRRWAGLWTLACDPCVTWSLELQHA